MLLNKKVATFFVAFTCLAAVGHSRAEVSFVQQVAVPGASDPSYVPGELIVKFRGGASLQAQDDTIRAFGDSRGKTVGRSGHVLVKLDPGRTVAQALANYTAMSDVESVQPNYIYKQMAVPNDPEYGKLWGLKNTGQNVNGFVGTAGADMNLEAAWNEITDCTGTVVAVLDSGVNYLHEDLAGNMWDGTAAGFPNHGADFTSSTVSTDPMPKDADFHGTHVAGTIAAVGNNGKGVTGVCWKARIMAVRALTASGGTTVAVVNGLNFAVAQGAKVVNMSFGGSGFDSVFESAIINARNNDVVIVAAAGNNGSSNDSFPTYPCSFPEDNIICVAALDQRYSRASFSNFGANSVDVGAPGVNTFSTWPGTRYTDDFSTWSVAGGWSAVNNCGPTTNMVNPSNYCAGVNYAANADDVATNIYPTLPNALFERFELQASVRMATPDLFAYNLVTGVADPFAGAVGFEKSGAFSFRGLAINICLSSGCTVGVRLRSNDDGIADRGVNVSSVTRQTVEPDSHVYEFLNGTSMATPHVSGLVAMIRSLNPNYTYADVVNSVKLGGDSVTSLAGITTTGRAVDAFGSVRHINPPTNFGASLVSSP